jgi:hypothetical protein
VSDASSRAPRRARVARVAVEGMVAALTVVACRGAAPASTPGVVVARVTPVDAGAGSAWAPKTAPAVAVEPAAKLRDCCRGRNACKGLSGCRGDDHDCRGKNECKGLGTSCAPDGEEPLDVDEE